MRQGDNRVCTPAFLNRKNKLPYYNVRWSRYARELSQRRRPRIASNTTIPNSLPIHVLLLQQRKFTPPKDISWSLIFRIACHLPTCVSGRPGISLEKGVALPLGKNATEHAIGTLGFVGAEKQPMLLNVESEESAVTSGMREGVGVLVDSVKRRGGH